MWKRIEKDISKTVLNLKVLGLKTNFPYSNLYIISVVYSLFKGGKRALSPTKKKEVPKVLSKLIELRVAVCRSCF